MVKGAKWAAKNWKKVAPIALLAASAFFTFGASLGLTAGWSAKVGTLVSKLGITGKIGNILSGAIVQAGRGALMGGITGAVTGQGFMRGAAAGAAIGAVTGGVTGGFQPTGGTDLLTNRANIGDVTKAVNPGMGQAGTPILAPDASRSLASSFGSVWDKVVGSGGIGPIIQGVGAGLARGAEQKAITKRDDDRRDSYNIEYRPIKSMFSNESGRILSTRAGEA